jgi:hypothetical protein
MGQSLDPRVNFTSLRRYQMRPWPEDDNPLIYVQTLIRIMDVWAEYKLSNGDYSAGKAGISEFFFVSKVEDNIGGACCVGVFGK